MHGVVIMRGFEATIGWTLHQVGSLSVAIYRENYPIPGNFVDHIFVNNCMKCHFSEVSRYMVVCETHTFAKLKLLFGHGT